LGSSPKPVFPLSESTLGLPKPFAAPNVEQWRTLSVAATLGALTLMMGILCGAF
jgi:hypothetical protein